MKKEIEEVFNFFLDVNEDINWVQVTSLKSFQEKEFKKSTQKRYGFYILFSSKKIYRLKSSSHILYVGCGKVKDRLIALFDFLFDLNNNKTTRKHTAKKDVERILNDADLGVKICVAYCLSDSKERVKNMETKILRYYCEKHFEPPPLNHSRK